MTYLNWSLLSVALLALLLDFYQEWNRSASEKRWQKIFCEMHSIRASILEETPAEAATAAPKPDLRKRISIPLPGASLWRNGGAKP